MMRGRCWRPWSPGPLDERVRDRIVAETRGNPLALLELPRGRTPAELAGGFGLDGGPALSGRIEERFRERLAALPPATRLLLLVAAAEPVGDPLLVWKAAAALGIDAGAAAPATAAGLVEFGAQVRFRHPLVRSAVYGAAAPEDRQRVHRALAEATDADVDPDRRAWHRAQATAGLDEDVAAELERSAGRARARGGLAAGAAFHERAAELTPDPRRRAQRALAAAQGKHQAGAPDAALRLLAMAEAGPLDELEQRAGAAAARADHVRRRRAAAMLRRCCSRRPSGSSRWTRRSRARRTSRRSPRRSPPTAWCAAAMRARSPPRSSPPTGSPPTRARAICCSTGSRCAHVEGYAVGAPALKEALRAFRDEPLSEEEELRWLWLACHIARALGDDVAWDELTARQVELARRAGALSLLPVALDDRFHVDLFCGRLAVATSLAAEADAVVEATGSHLTLRGAIALANWRGQEAEALALIEARRQDVLRRGEGLWLAATDWGTAVRYNGLGRYDEALAAAERAAEDPHGLGTPMWVLRRSHRGRRPQRQAGARRRPARAAGRDRRGQRHRLGARVPRPLARRCSPRGRPPSSSTARRSSGSAAPASAWRSPARMLVYGEWLRRENRRVDAREQLRAAHEMLTEMGMEAFAERARRELLATGETVRKRTVETLDDLTPQEAQIGRMAADGLTNPEIGAQLFLSPRTVEWHLRKVFGKLGISSRRELRTALPDRGAGLSGRARLEARFGAWPRQARRAPRGARPQRETTTPCASSM